MSQITVYTTEPCGYCRVAKALLDKRGVAYEEINLAKDPEGRAELVRLTGMMTFPQVVIDGETHRRLPGARRVRPRRRPRGARRRGLGGLACARGRGWQRSHT